MAERSDDGSAGQDELAARLARWESETVAPALARHPERDHLASWSGLPTERVYLPPGPVPDGYLDRVGLPGEFPFTRGVQPTGYRARTWTRRPITGFRSAGETNARIQELLRAGQSGLHIVFDYPTLTGYDSDDPIAFGEIGVSGVPIDSIQDVRELFAGIDLRAISTSYSHWGPYILSMFLAHAEEQGIAPAELAGTSQNDVLMYYHSCPWWDLPLRANMKLFVDVVEYAVHNMPRWNPVSISGYNIRDGGCSAVQEMAFTFGDAIAYLDACIERGLTVEQVAPRFSFMLCAGMDLFEEIGKMRAMRRMWANIIRDRYGCDDPSCQKLRFHAQTSGASLTAQQPLNNIVRGTVEALAAALGGAQSMHVSCYDETYGLPTESAIRMSLNTQNIVATEAGVVNTVDPLGGSYFVEALTDELEAKAWELLEQVTARGGMVAAAESGWVRQQKHDWAVDYQAEIESGERTIVGVNAFESTEAERIEFMRPDIDAQRAQIDRLRERRSRRDDLRVRRAIDGLRNAAKRVDNVIPAAVQAAHAEVTLGEMYRTMREVYGEVPAEERQYL